MAGVLVQYLPSPTHLVYVVFGAVFIAQAIGLNFMADTIAPRKGVSLIAQHGNILATAQIFGAVIIGLAFTALLGSVLQRATRK